jgi:hypothetical protein
MPEAFFTRREALPSEGPARARAHGAGPLWGGGARATYELGHLGPLGRGPPTFRWRNCGRYRRKHRCSGAALSSLYLKLASDTDGGGENGGSGDLRQAVVEILDGSGSTDGITMLAAIANSD